MKTSRYREPPTVLTHMPMFDEGDLLFFDPFKFEDGTSKPKFFVVLKNENGLSLLASLPTSKDHIPADLDVHAGCYEFPERGVNVYVFLAGETVATDPVTGRDYHFSKNTFIYGATLNLFPVAPFLQQQLNHETTITTKGKLKQDLFNNLKECLKNSALVKNKFKRML